MSLDAITFPLSIEPARHVPHFLRNGEHPPLGSAFCLRCDALIRLADMDEECRKENDR